MKKVSEWQTGRSVTTHRAVPEVDVLRMVDAFAENGCREVKAAFRARREVTERIRDRRLPVLSHEERGTGSKGQG